MTTVRQLIEKININGAIRFNEPMSLHTSYRIGGPADIYVEPLDLEEFTRVFLLIKETASPFFLLGGGSNILVSDRGIRGLVINTANLRHMVIQEDTCSVGAGMAVSDLAEYLGLSGFGGLETFYAMPGSLGGAVWMNARCYDVSISEVLQEVTLLTPSGELQTYRVRPEDFDYKVSPFQADHRIIVETTFRLRRDDPAALTRRMADIRADRKKKGHFAYPSAGSVFKNNRSFGKPSGAIIDSLGLRGYGVGKARVSPLHANFIINEGGALAEDVRAVIRHVQESVLEAYGYTLEPEVLLVGEWEVS
ncbi:MAG: UDP-N-acetylmuramate dehydrogenase [Spirochaetales bacterium]|nr:UDP-N-acetylmuramate dehydrogenase [Spirochaetales bacterium]